MATSESAFIKIVLFSNIPALVILIVLRIFSLLTKGDIFLKFGVRKEEETTQVLKKQNKAGREDIQRGVLIFLNQKNFIFTLAALGLMEETEDLMAAVMAKKAQNLIVLAVAVELLPSSSICRVPPMNRSTA